jgi:hypothetical protein
MSQTDTTVLQENQLAVATVEQSGTIVSGASATDTTALVQTDDGLQLCQKVLPLNGGGGGGGGDGADTDLSNLTNTGKIKAAHLAMPSGVYDELTIPAVDGSNITVPADGYLCLRGVANGESPVLGLTNNTTGMNITSNATFMSALDFGVTLPVKKGDSVKVGFYHINFNDPSAPGFLRFVYANGSENEHQGA